MKMQMLEFEKPIAELEKNLEDLCAQAQAQNIDLQKEIKAIEEKKKARICAVLLFTCTTYSLVSELYPEMQ